MKRLLIAIMCAVCILLTGCMKKYPLTDTQTDVVAEYMANLLLRNDKNYMPSLLSYKEVLGMGRPNRKSRLPTRLRRRMRKIHTARGSGNEEISEEEQETQHSLSDVMGDPNFDIVYTGCQLAETYPPNNRELVFSIDPRVGNQLLVLNFTVENITGQSRRIDLSSAGIKYRLDTSLGTIYKPTFALLENNLEYIKMDVGAGEKIPAVLIFEIPKDTEVSYMVLTVSGIQNRLRLKLNNIIIKRAFR